jgi:hypothetical protein
MMTLTIPDELETQLNTIARNRQISPIEFVIELLKSNFDQQAVQNDADALVIHEQLMMQYAETFEKLAQ